MDTSWECVVIGGGAAGLSAALVLGRARRRTLLIDAGGQSNLTAHGIGGLLGQDGRPAADFYADGNAELAKYPEIKVRGGQVAGVVAQSEGFTVELAGGEVIRAAHVVLATGADYGPPPVEGIAERFGRGAFHCPFCHGWEHRDGALAALDPGPHGAGRALLLRAWSDDVTLLTDGPAELTPEQLVELKTAGVTLDARPIAAFTGPGAELESVQFQDGTSRPCTGLLVPVTLTQRGGLAAALGAEIATEGFFAGQVLKVDPMGQTSIPGLWAVGDAATNGPSVAGAIESGGRAAGGIVHHLSAALGKRATATA